MEENKNCTCGENCCDEESYSALPPELFNHLVDVWQKESDEETMGYIDSDKTTNTLDRFIPGLSSLPKETIDAYLREIKDPETEIDEEQYKNINKQIIDSFDETYHMSFIATDGLVYNREFDIESLSELLSGKQIIEYNMTIIEQTSSVIFDDTTEFNILIGVVDLLNDYVTNLYGDDFFALIDLHETNVECNHKELRMKTIELFTNAILIGNALLKMVMIFENEKLNQTIDGFSTMFDCNNIKGEMNI